MVQDPKDEELRKYYESIRPDSVTDEYQLGTPLDQIIPPKPLFSRADYDQENKDAQIWEDKKASLTKTDLLRHAVGETWVLHPKMWELWDMNWEGEPGYVLPWKEYTELRNGVPFIAWDDIRNAKSHDQAKAIRESAIKSVNEQGLMAERYGAVPMFFAYMGAGVMDPVNLALMWTGRNLYKAAADVAKYSRLARFARVGTMATIEGAAVVGARAYQDPLQDEWNVMFAATLSGIIGGSLGGRIWKGKTPTPITPRVTEAPGLVLRREAAMNMPERSPWQRMWNIDDGHVIYYEPDALNTSAKWANTKQGRILLALDADKNPKGMLFESSDGYAAFRVDMDGTVRFWNQDYRINGVIDSRGNVHLNMETLTLRDKLQVKAFEGNSHPLKVEQLIKETMAEFHKKWRPDYDSWSQSARQAQRKDPRKYPADLDPDEAAAAGGTKGYVYDSTGKPDLPELAVNTIEAQLHRAARLEFGDDTMDLYLHLHRLSTMGPLSQANSKLFYEVTQQVDGFTHSLRNNLQRLTFEVKGGRILWENMNAEDIRLALKHGVVDPETGKVIPRREMGEMDGLSISKLTSKNRRLREREMAQIRKENDALREAELTQYKQQLLDEGEGTPNAFLNRFVVGPDASADSPIGLVIKINEDGTVVVDYGAMYKETRNYRPRASQARADRAKKAWESAKKESEVEGGVPARETEAGDPWRHVDPDDLEAPSETVLFPERVVTQTVDEITPLPPSVLSKEFLETPIILKTGKLAPLTPNQQIKVFESIIDDLSTPAIQQRRLDINIRKDRLIKDNASLKEIDALIYKRSFPIQYGELKRFVSIKTLQDRRTYLINRIRSGTLFIQTLEEEILSLWGKHRGKQSFALIEHEASPNPYYPLGRMTKKHRLSDMSESEKAMYEENAVVSQNYVSKGTGEIPEDWYITTQHGVDASEAAILSKNPYIEKPSQAARESSIRTRIKVVRPTIEMVEGVDHAGEPTFTTREGGGPWDASDFKEFNETYVYPVMDEPKSPVTGLGFGTQHYIEILKSAKRMGVGLTNDWADGTSLAVSKIYARLKEAGVPFGESGDIRAKDLVNRKRYWISPEELQKVDLDEVLKTVTKLNKEAPPYAPKRTPMEYTGTGPSGEPFRVEVYPRSPYKEIGITSKDIYAGGQTYIDGMAGVKGYRDKKLLSELTRTGTLNWNGPKEYTLFIEGGPKLGYDLAAQNKAQLADELRQILLDRTIRKHNEQIQNLFETQAERVELAKQARIEAEVLHSSLEMRRLELEEVADLLNHIPEHLRMRRWAEVQATINKLRMEMDDIPRRTRHIDMDDIEIITPDGRVIDASDIRRAKPRAKSTIFEELRGLDELDNTITKLLSKIDENKVRIAQLRRALKAKGTSKEDKVIIGAEIKKLSGSNNRARAKIRTAKKDIESIEATQKAGDIFTRPSRKDSAGRRHTIIYDTASDDWFFIRNKSTGKTRTVDDIIRETEQAERTVRAKEAQIKNAETGKMNAEAFDDTPSGLDGISADDAAHFEDTGFGAKVLGWVDSMPFNGIKTRAQNIMESGMTRWYGFRVLGGFQDEADEGAMRHMFKESNTKRVVEGSSPWGRRGIEEGRDEMVKMRLAIFDTLHEDLQEWRRLNKKGFFTYWTNTAQEEFGTIIGKISSDKTGQLIKQIPDHSQEVILRAVEKARKHWANDLGFLQKYGKGWEDVVSDPNYLPRFWDRRSIAIHRSKEGMNIHDDELANVFANGLIKANKEAIEEARVARMEGHDVKGPRALSPEEAYTIGHKFLDRIGNNNFRLNLINDASHQKATALELAKILERDFGMTPGEALHAAEAFRVTEKRARHQMYRLRLDLDEVTTVLNRNNEELKVSLSDMIDFDFFKAARRYARHTSSKLLISNLIEEANIKSRIPGKFKNLDDILEVIEEDLKKKGITGRRLEKIMHMNDVLTKIARDEPFSESTEAALYMQLARQITYSLGHGMRFGIAAIAEASSANWVQGVKGFMESMPALRRMVDGVVDVDKAQLHEFAASLGMGIREIIIPRLDLMGRIVEEGGNTAVGRQQFFRRFWMGATRVTSEVSGLMKLTEWSDHVALKRHMVHYGNMMIKGEMPNNVRLVDMGLTHGEWERIAKQVRKQFKKQVDDTGVETYQYDFSSWDDQGAVDLFAQAMQGEVKSVVQRSSRGDMPLWNFRDPTAHEITKMVLQYRGFGMSSVSNYVVRNMRASDARSLWVLASSIAGGTVAYVIKGMLAYEDTPEGRERFKERMTLTSIAKGSILQSGFSAGSENLTLLSGPLLGVDVYGNYHRQGLSNSWVDQVRAFSFADDVAGLFRSLIQTQVMGSRDFTRADYRRVQRVLGFMRHPLLAPFVKDLGNGLPTQSR